MIVFLIYRLNKDLIHFNFVIYLSLTHFGYV